MFACPKLIPYLLHHNFLQQILHYLVFQRKTFFWLWICITISTFTSSNQHENEAEDLKPSGKWNFKKNIHYYPNNLISVDLEQENQRLKEARICKICMDSEIGVVFLPCGHFICCVQCAPSLRDCPLCRQSIHGTVKTYMSWFNKSITLLFCVKMSCCEVFSI